MKGINIPSDFAVMMPYVLTIVALAFAVRRARNPAALGRPTSVERMKWIATSPMPHRKRSKLYIRTYYSLLRTSDEVQIKSLVEAHGNMESSLHPLARSDQPDLSAFIYSMLRLPTCINDVKLVVLGQSGEVFARHGFDLTKGWQAVSSPARRRRCFYDGEQTLAVFIASYSDIDDLIPMLTAYQIEWNKFNQRLRDVKSFDDLDALPKILDVSADDLDRLRRLWGRTLANGWERWRHPQEICRAVVGEQSQRLSPRSAGLVRAYRKILRAAG